MQQIKNVQIEMEQIPVVSKDLIIQIRNDQELSPTKYLQLKNAFEERWPDKQFLFVVGADLSLLSDEEMNAAGWYRKDE